MEKINKCNVLFHGGGKKNLMFFFRQKSRRCLLGGGAGFKNLLMFPDVTG
jgi:hypothetical protein